MKKDKRILAEKHTETKHYIAISTRDPGAIIDFENRGYTLIQVNWNSAILYKNL